jgi:HK97 family phage major capsid protein
MKVENQPALPALRELPRAPHLTLSPREVRDFSIHRALRAAYSGDWSKAGFERSVTLALIGDEPHESNRLIIPPQVLARDLVAGSGPAGGFLVETSARGVLDSLRPILATARLGASIITGLQSNVTYARNAGGLTITWQATESTQAVETDNFATGQIALTPKTATAFVEASRLFQLMTADAGEAMILRELRLGLATAVDAAAFTGTGASGQPTGILNIPGIGTFTGASINYAALLESQTDILSNNALSEGGRVAFVCRPAVASLLANRQGFNANSGPCWQGPLAEGTVIGCPAMSTMQLPAATLLAGDFSQMLLAEWGSGVDIRVDPYSGFLAGRVGMAASISVDVSCGWPQAFSVATSVS